MSDIDLLKADEAEYKCAVADVQTMIEIALRHTPTINEDILVKGILTILCGKFNPTTISAMLEINRNAKKI